ncbi:pheromone A receptor-domain-containing protein [Phyllosticta citrichinensis]|uniref:Pheromone A receptor-domain-containing protein n=1 Tax=Phyllosticta citrichinensis TaxID=1130410 RepID=A0ABR1XXE4_9PEZI
MWDPYKSLVSRSDDYPVFPLAYIVPILATIVIILNIPPIVWHYKNKNLAACTLVLWVILLNFTVFLNPILWPNDDLAHWFSGVGVCDIQVYFFVGTWTGISCCLLCIMRGLARIMDTKNTVVSSESSRKRHLITDAVICFVPVILQMSTFYVVQGRRYFIYGINGCVTVFNFNWVAIILLAMWPLVICTVVAVYALLILVRLHRYRIEFSRLLSTSGTTKSRFLRLFIMATISVIVLLPSQSYVLYANTRPEGLRYSWAEVHNKYWNQPVAVSTGGRLRFDRWIWLLSGLVNFLFFGLGVDAFAIYRKWLGAIGLHKLCCCGARRPSILPLSSVSQQASVSKSRTGSSPSIRSRLTLGHKAYVVATTVDRSAAPKPQHAKKRSLFTFWRTSTDEECSRLTSNTATTTATTTTTTAPTTPHTPETRDAIASSVPFPPNYSLRKPSAAPSYGTDASGSTVIGSPVSEKRFSGLREIELGPVSPRMMMMGTMAAAGEAKEEKDGGDDDDRAEDARRLEEYVVEELCYIKSDKEVRKLWTP